MHFTNKWLKRLRLCLKIYRKTTKKDKKFMEILENIERDGQLHREIVYRSNVSINEKDLVLFRA